MKLVHRLSLSLAVSAALSGYTQMATATNGMVLEGYGPIAKGMGGASMAYDNGTAGMMNNPATLGLMPEGDQIDAAIGYLGPNVTTTVNMPGQSMSTDSDGTSYWMPAIGWIEKRGPWGYGLGVFSQGGMGTEYAANSPLTLGSGQEVRSELSVGSVLFPLTYQINPQLSVGGTLEYVWAGLDLKMAIPGSSLGAMMQRGAGMDVPAMGEAGGSLAMGMQQMGINPQWARFDFSNGSKFSGSASGGGVAGKLGLVYQLSPELAMGLTYHSATHMSDLETSKATLSMQTGQGVQAISGKISVIDFQWPDLFGIGFSYKPSNVLQLVGDIKYIGWQDVMKNMDMLFVADSNPNNGPFIGADLNARLYQNWSNQTVFSLGAAYKYTDQLTLRAGVNLSKNPVPDSTLSFLFPAIIRNHLSLGAGYELSDHQALNFEMTYAFKIDQTTADGSMTVGHSQYNWSLMYSHRF